MSVHRYITGTRLATWHRCRLSFRWAYLDRKSVEPGTTAHALVVGSLLHSCLAEINVTRPSGDRFVLATMESVLDDAREKFSQAEIDRARPDVAQCLLEFERWPGRLPRGEDEAVELDLRAEVGPLTLAARLDHLVVLPAVREGDAPVLVAEEYKTSEPPEDALLLQTTLTHAGLRARYGPRPAIRHRLVVFRAVDGHREVRDRDVELTPDAYRGVIASVYEAARDIAREREWAASPTERACGWCQFAGVCPHAAALVHQTAAALF